MGWTEHKDYYRVYESSKVFNGCKYVIIIDIEMKEKSTRFWVAVTSGKKRSQRDQFEHKRDKSIGGMKALFWLRDEMLTFPAFFEKRYISRGLPMHICIEWADSRRRDIYERLRKEGFYFMNIDGKKILIKNIKQNVNS